MTENLKQKILDNLYNSSFNVSEKDVEHIEAYAEQLLSSYKKIINLQEGVLEDKEKLKEFTDLLVKFMDKKDG